MNIQIFGKSKCFETKKAERYFKERRVKVQSIDLPRYGISPGELKSVLQSVPFSEIADERHPDYAVFKHLAFREDQERMLLETPALIRTPIVRNGKKATLGYQPEVWKSWE